MHKLKIGAVRRGGGETVILEGTRNNKRDKKGTDKRRLRLRERKGLRKGVELWLLSIILRSVLLLIQRWSKHNKTLDAKDVHGLKWCARRVPLYRKCHHYLAE